MERTYTLQELFDDLPIPLAELARQSAINEVTLARIRDGRQTRRDTANKLLRKLSEVYGKELNLRNVTGINVMVNKRLAAKEARQSEEAA
jgi:predicted transcriptional regulator